MTDCCRRLNQAVDSICLGVRQKECFGLLGVNGECMGGFGGVNGECVGGVNGECVGGCSVSYIHTVYIQ